MRPAPPISMLPWELRPPISGAERKAQRAVVKHAERPGGVVAHELKGARVNRGPLPRDDKLPRLAGVVRDVERAERHRAPLDGQARRVLKRSRPGDLGDLAHVVRVPAEPERGAMTPHPQAPGGGRLIEENLVWSNLRGRPEDRLHLGAGDDAASPASGVMEVAVRRRYPRGLRERTRSQTEHRQDGQHARTPTTGRNTDFELNHLKQAPSKNKRGSEQTIHHLGETGSLRP